MLQIRDNVALAPYTTLGIGGAARYFADANSLDDVREAERFAKERTVPLCILGGGSNVVVADEGFPGLVLRVAIQGIRITDAGEYVTFHVNAGEVWDELVAHAVEHECAGIECLSGIPGWVGAAPIQNIGAYGQELADTLVSATAFERSSGALVELTVDECMFTYRDSVFKRQPGRWIVLGITLRLRKRGAPTLKYPELVRAVSVLGRPPTVADVRRTVLELRNAKAMVLDERDPDTRSAGSFFVNPVVTQRELTEILKHVESALGPGSAPRMPQFPQPDGNIKLSAAWLIEQSGFTKGTVRGHVGLSTKHALALINRGGASARELMAFAHEIQTRVAERFGAHLVPEPRLIGTTPTLAPTP